MNNKALELEKRTSDFGASTIVFCKSFKPSPVVAPLISQLVRSSTSIGANYIEANSASSKKDFKNKVHIAKKEAEESKHWLKMLIKAQEGDKARISDLYTECNELTLIFGKILSTMRNSEINQ